MASERKVNEWRCGMCGRWNPRRRRSRCHGCGAVKGMGYRYGDRVHFVGGEGRLACVAQEGVGEMRAALAAADGDEP